MWLLSFHAAAQYKNDRMCFESSWESRYAFLQRNR